MNALSLYVAMAQDASSFPQMVANAPDEVLQELYLLLSIPNPDLDAEEAELHAVGKATLEALLQERDLTLPEIPPIA